MRRLRAGAPAPAMIAAWIALLATAVIAAALPVSAASRAPARAVAAPAIDAAPTGNAQASLTSVAMSDIPEPPPTTPPAEMEAAVFPADADQADQMEPEPTPEPAPTMEEHPRPRPRRAYPVPVAGRGASWPFGPDVYRWQPLVEQQLRAVAATRRLDPALTPELVLAVIDAESLGDPLAVSSADAIGLMQVLPSTFAEVMGDGDPFDPELNVRAGILYLNFALAWQQGDVEWALAAYHAGPTASARARAGEEALFDVTLDYVETVVDYRDRALLYRGLAPPVPPPAPNVREWLRPPEVQVAAVVQTAGSGPTPGPTAAKAGAPAAALADQSQPGAPAASAPAPPDQFSAPRVELAGGHAPTEPAASAKAAPADASPTATATSTPTATHTPTPSATASPTASATPSATASPTQTPNPARAASTSATPATATTGATPTAAGAVARAAGAR